MQIASSDKKVRGGALIEFALTLPLLFLIIANVVNFGGMIYAWIAVSNAARAGADYMILSGASTGSPARVSDANTTALVQADLHALPNSSSATITVCTPYSSPSCTPPTDPESGAGTPCAAGTGQCYVDGSVDVTYTYTPFIGSGYKAFGIPLTLPATSIHRKAVARIIQ